MKTKLLTALLMLSACGCATAKPEVDPQVEMAKDCKAKIYCVREINGRCELVRTYVMQACIFESQGVALRSKE